MDTALESLLTVPFPKKPGTLCDWGDSVKPGPDWRVVLRCIHCGGDQHGGSKWDAKELGIPESEAHKLCPAPKAAWDEYWAARRRAHLDSFVSYFTRELMMLSSENRWIALQRIQAAVK